MSHDIPSTAPEWIARMNAGPLSPELQTAFEAWLASDSGNQAAFTLARLTWSVAERLNASEVARNELRALAAAPVPWSQRLLGVLPDRFAAGPRAWAPAFAALLMVVVSTVWYLEASRGPVDPFLLSQDQSAATGLGEISNYNLPDGSKVTVNAQSAVRMAFTRTERTLILERGEAFFEVHPDSKPFVVVAGARRVVVTGTKFDVKLDDYRSGLQVAVVEGHVNVGNGAETNNVTPLKANDVFLFPDNGAPERLQVAANLISAWQTRRLHFEGTTVGDVLFSVNRFAPKPLRLANPQLAELPMSGSFPAGDTDAVLFSLQSLYGIEATDRGDVLILSTVK